MSVSFLKRVSFSEYTIVLDGDLSVSTKDLAWVAFENRRHYSHRREEFGTAYFCAYG
jgi:hypothetical protein